MDITAFSLGTNAVQIEWKPVPAEYTNGEVTGYKVHYGDVNAISRSNRIVPSSTENRLKISDLKSNTNYSFQILAFTEKGDGPSSVNYFARTGPGTIPFHMFFCPLHDSIRCLIVFFVFRCFTPTKTMC